MSKQEVRPFGFRDKIGYMFGDIANDFSFIFASSYVMVFYTKVMGISAGMVGTMFLVARCIDAFTDIGMGRIVDRSKPTKNGRIRPWILRMCAFVALASFLMYQSFLVDASYGAKVAYMFITYILWGSIFYTSINIPYGSMASVISADPKDRSSLSVFRSMGGGIAGILIGVCLQHVNDRRCILCMCNRMLSVMLCIDTGTCRVCSTAGIREKEYWSDIEDAGIQQSTDWSDYFSHLTAVGISDVSGC